MSRWYSPQQCKRTQYHNHHLAAVDPALSLQLSGCSCDKTKPYPCSKVSHSVQLACTFDLAAGSAGQRGRTVPAGAATACAAPCLAEWQQLPLQFLHVHTSSPLHTGMESYYGHKQTEVAALLVVKPPICTHYLPCAEEYAHCMKRMGTSKQRVLHVLWSNRPCAYIVFPALRNELIAEGL